MENSSKENILISQLLDDETSWDDKFQLAYEIKTPENLEIGILNSIDPEIRLILLQKIVDKKIIENVAQSDGDALVRLTALNKLPNSYHELFMELASKDEDALVRHDALAKLPVMYQPFFVDILIKEEIFKIRKLAREKIRLPELPEEELTKLAINAWDGLVRQAVIRYISTPELLVKIAIEGGDYRIAETAVENLSDETQLMEICQKGEFAHVRAKAAQKISDENYLAQLFETDPSPYVRETCIEKISKIEILAALRLLASGSLQKQISYRINHLTK